MRNFLFVCIENSNRSQMAQAFATILGGEHFLVVLDEIMYPLRYGWLPLEPVLQTLRERPSHVHVCLTGRGAPQAKRLSSSLRQALEVASAFRFADEAAPPGRIRADGCFQAPQKMSAPPPPRRVRTPAPLRSARRSCRGVYQVRADPRCAAGSLLVGVVLESQR